MATLTISFTPLLSAPADGYVVKYREAGGGAYTQVSPNPTSSPVVITGLDGTKAYEGYIQSACEAGIQSDPVLFSVGAIAVLNNFDFLVLRYRNNSGGSDLDTFTGFVDNGISEDIDYGASSGTTANWVGYGGDNTSNYITWAGDNQTIGGVEAVLVDFPKLITDFPSLGDTIRVRLHAWWYDTRSTGDAQLELQTWLGGTAPTLNAPAYDFVKTDGTTVDHVLLDTNVTCERHGIGSLVGCAQRLGEIIYNKVSKTAVLVPISGGCDCVHCFTYTLTNTTGTGDWVDYNHCDGSPADSVFVNPGDTITVCAQADNVFPSIGYVTVTQGSAC